MKREEGEREEKKGEERKRRGESVTARRYGGNMGRGGVCVHTEIPLVFLCAYDCVNVK